MENRIEYWIAINDYPVWRLPDLKVAKMKYNEIKDSVELDGKLEILKLNIKFEKVYG